MFRLPPWARTSVPLASLLLLSNWLHPLLHSKSSFILISFALNPEDHRGRKFCVLVHNAPECSLRRQDMSRNKGERFLSSFFLILNFLQIYFQVPDPSFLLSQSLCCLCFLLRLLHKLPSHPFFSPHLFILQSVVHIFTSQTRKRTSGTGYRYEKEIQDHSVAKFHFFLPRLLNLQMKHGALTIPHHYQGGLLLGRGMFSLY